MPPVSGYLQHLYRGLSRVTFLQKIGTEQEFILGEKSLKTLRLAEGARNALLTDLQPFSE